MNLIEAIMQRFCKHEYEEKEIAGFLVVDGWFVQPKIKKCKKCGKVLKEE